MLATSLQLNSQTRMTVLNYPDDQACHGIAKWYWALLIKELAMEYQNADEYLQWNNQMNELAVGSPEMECPCS